MLYRNIRNSTLSYIIARSGIESYRVVHIGKKSYRNIRNSTLSYRVVWSGT